MIIFMKYYSFLTILLYFVVKIIKLSLKETPNEIAKEFIKAMIVVPILVYLYFKP